MKLPRFKLRTLFVLIAIGTLAAWAFWIGWPRWQLLREQAKFEEAAKEIHAGVSIHHRPALPFGQTHQIYSDADDQGNIIALEKYNWPNVTFFVCYTLPFDDKNNVELMETPFTKVRLYKFSTLKRDYRARTKKGGQPQYYLSTRNPNADELAEAAFMGDLFTFASDPNSISDFPCELIYSDPPIVAATPK